MLDRPITLSASVLNRTIRSANLGELHITLAPTAVWTPSENDHAADVKARDEIARLGGIDRRGRLDIDLEATLSLLCKPRAEFYGWLNYDHATIAVLVAASGRDAVLAIRTGDTVSLTQAQPEHLPELLIAQAPDVPPARGHTITVTLADLKPDTSQVSVGVGARHGKPEVRMAQQIMETPTTGGGQLFTAVRDSMGRRHRVTHPLRYIDTVHGRWINVTLPGQERRVFLAPADRRAVVGRLHDMHVGLTGR